MMQQWPSVLAPAGPQASSIARLSWFAFAVAAIVYLVTIGALCWALWRAGGRVRDGSLPGPDSEQRMTRGVTWALAATIVTLLIFFGYDLSVGRTLSTSVGPHPLTIEVTGHQWWWEAQYADTSPHGRFTTANEIHIPAGRPVLFLLSANDVIHSVWVPSLGGKKDLIPGYTQSVWFQADTPGVYRGQCAEFCGLQHAKMAMFVVADPPADFTRWVEQQRRPAPAPADSLQRRGQDVFLTRSCVLCHAIDGTEAGSHNGPDLTHLASRRTIAAGTLTNTWGNLASWITDPHAFKPGTRMPPNLLSPQDLDALVTYLQSLK
jgi:cytochrome c oxidase subunit 2